MKKITAVSDRRHFNTNAFTVLQHSFIILASSASVFFGGDSLVFFELTNEIADVVKATVNGNIRNRQ